MKRVLFLGAALAAVAVATPAAAQTTIGWDAAVFSSYVWRGVTYTNKPVLQPDLYLTFPLGTASFTAGGWANVNLGKYDGSSDLSESGGTGAFNVAEFDWWGEFGIPAGPAELTLGATGYIFPNPSSCGCFTSDANTIEVYGKVGLSGPLSPKLSAYYDVDKVKGLYVEGSVSHDVPLGPKSLTLGALLGYNNGQQFKGSTDKSFNFYDNGFTHLDLSAALGLSAGSLSITPSIHGVFGFDDATKITKPTSPGQQVQAVGWRDALLVPWRRGRGGVDAQTLKGSGGRESENGRILADSSRSCVPDRPTAQFPLRDLLELSSSRFSTSCSVSIGIPSAGSIRIVRALA